MSSSMATDTLPHFIQGTFAIPNFEFNDGHTLPELKVHYRTAGQLQRDQNGKPKNSVLLLHSTTSSGLQWLSPDCIQNLYQQGQALDISKHYIIMLDSIGHGRSSKPSDGLKSDFPKYDYSDMVRAQYLLVTQHLAVEHLKLVLGTSMGGMHTWVWATQFEGMMDFAIPIVSLPQEVSGRNRAWRKAAMECITQDPQYEDGHYEKQPNGLRHSLQIFQLMMTSPLQWQMEGPSAARSDAWAEAYVKERLEYQDANDFVYAFASSRDYDPRALLPKVQARVLAINFEQDQINPTELGLLESGMEQVRGGRYVIVPGSAKTFGHASLGHSQLWEGFVREHLQQ